MDNPRMGIPQPFAPEIEKELPYVYGALDNDLARDNLNNDYDLSKVDVMDLERDYPEDENDLV